MAARTTTVVTPDDPHGDPVRPTAIDQRPAAPGSPLFSLRAVRERRRAKLYVDLPVPRWADPVDGNPGTRLFVRFGPVSQSRVERLSKMTEKSRDPEKNVRLNASLLAEFCLGIYVLVDDDGAEVAVGVDPSADDASDPDQWPRFDDALAESLGLQSGLPAGDLVRATYFTDGDLMSTANRLTQWSGYVLTDAGDLEDEGRA